MEKKHVASGGGSLDLTAVGARIEAVRQDLEPHATPLSPRQRVAAKKWRPGYEAVTTAVTEQAPRVGVQIPGLSLGQMNDNLAEAKSTAAALSAARAVVKMLEDRVMLKRSEAVATAQVYWSALSRIGRNQPTLHAALADGRAFMATGKRPRHEVAGQAPATGTTPATGGDKAASTATK